MKNKNLLKSLGLVVCALLLIVCSVAGTFAYLTSEAKIENTFTAGKVVISMDETVVDEYGAIVEPSSRSTNGSNVSYKLIPGRYYKKDPIIHVETGSEMCYLFVKVENSISAIEGGTTIAAQMAAKGWTLLSGSANVYYKENVTPGDYPVFDGFTVKAEVGNSDLSALSNTKIIVTAYAIQADGFSGAADAWSKAPSSWRN